MGQDRCPARYLRKVPKTTPESGQGARVLLLCLFLPLRSKTSRLARSWEKEVRSRIEHREAL
jgi:hypothetical protein